MERISSRSTFFMKRVLPATLVGLVLLQAAVILMVRDRPGHSPHS